MKAREIKYQAEMLTADGRSCRGVVVKDNGNFVDFIADDDEYPERFPVQAKMVQVKRIVKRPSSQEILTIQDSLDMSETSLLKGNA